MSDKYDVIDNRACFVENYPYCNECIPERDSFEEEEETVEEQLSHESFTRKQIDDAIEFINTYQHYQCVGKMIAAIHLLHTLDDSYENIRDELEFTIMHEFELPCVRHILMKVLYDEDYYGHFCHRCARRGTFVTVIDSDSNSPVEIGVCTECYHAIPLDEQVSE